MSELFRRKFHLHQNIGSMIYPLIKEVQMKIKHMRSMLVSGQISAEETLLSTRKQVLEKHISMAEKVKKQLFH